MLPVPSGSLGMSPWIGDGQREQAVGSRTAGRDAVTSSTAAATDAGSTGRQAIGHLPAGVEGWWCMEEGEAAREGCIQNQPASTGKKIPVGMSVR